MNSISCNNNDNNMNKKNVTDTSIYLNKYTNNLMKKDHVLDHIWSHIGCWKTYILVFILASHIWYLSSFCWPRNIFFTCLATTPHESTLSIFLNRNITVYDTLMIVNDRNWNETTYIHNHLYNFRSPNYIQNISEWKQDLGFPLREKIMF